MDRRSFVAALAGWPALPLFAQDDPRPRHRLSAAQLHEALSARFPLLLGIPGLAQIQVSAPRLLLLPARNKLGASLHAEASGSAFGRLPPGEVDVVFALRYESADRSVRAHEPDIVGIDWPGLTAEGKQALQSLLPGMAREVAAELVLHKFTSRELALPDTMGLEPSTLTVVDDGVVVEFREKRMRAG
ncbi:DUF1439 domain-containing protein [Ramlibacter algicola]|uniref:DUF1439 domain-containing protein n=1 Tax=Ramlibacter algicola TaxID=2795217 RepID=A0A934Q0B0_9BURK|nr:DUF1439 domain-containing protein [Ramlibacter algicola]MBK0392713.1 DUF1439 domain-containing protein [Ramlibacter algicola]